MSRIIEQSRIHLEMKRRNGGGEGRVFGNDSIPFHVLLKEAIFSCT